MKERGRPGEWHVSTARADRPIGTRSSSNASLLSLTCHGIASDFERSSIILKCETFDDRHTELFESKDALNLYINDSEIDPILPEEWKIIECCVELLKPLKKPHVNLAVLTLISSVIPIIRMLTQKENFRLYWKKKTHILATDLDPRYKNKFFTSLTEEKIKDDILKISRNTEDILASRTISPSTERAKKMRMTDSMDTDSERPGTSGTGRQSCLISDLAMILDSSSDDESQKTPEINNSDIRIRIRGCEPLKIRIRIRGCGKKWIRNIPSVYTLIPFSSRHVLTLAFVRRDLNRPSNRGRFSVELSPRSGVRVMSRVGGFVGALSLDAVSKALSFIPIVESDTFYWVPYGQELARIPPI
ncbi:hypothetical protein EVAR_74352_1 [Eumeta japonica]|uniref:Uncharacterized protein n=1 Tax=Eumeta variegata TaxID=151549 RepID=A0A4C1SCW0_EUMVA|nr:hypothetical protein EVAR_74352_1 [Eumeta japonica]